MMVLLTRFPTPEAARRPIETEPYTASGLVFSAVEVNAWSQVLPEVEAGALQREIAKERSL